MRPSLKRLVNQSNSTINWVFRYYPSQHNTESAEYKYQAAECSDMLGGKKAYWLFTEKMFIQPRRNKIASETLVSRAAKGSNLDINDIEQCINSKQFLEKVRRERTEAVALNFKGTPSMVFVNHLTGRSLRKQGALNYNQLKTLLSSLE